MVTRNEAIVLHLRELSDLLNQDPSPLSHGAIRPEAETYIARKAKQLRGTGPIRLVIELPPAESKSKERAKVENAVANHFRNAAYSEATDLRELFRSGCKASSMIGERGSTYGWLLKMITQGEKCSAFSGPLLSALLLE